MAFKIPNVADVSNPSQASVDSADLQALAAGATAIGVVGGLTISAQGTPNMTVQVQGGVVRFPSGNQQFIPQTISLTVATANATNPRHDVVVAVEGAVMGSVAIITGTPAAYVAGSSEPKYPAIPAGRVLLGVIYVPALQTSITNSLIGDRRVTVSNAWWDGSLPRPAALWPFTIDSPLNLPVSTNAIFQRATDPATASFIAPTTSAGTINAWVTYQGWNLPITQATTSDPLATMTDTSDSTRSDVYRIPANAPIATGTDGSMGIVDPTGRFCHETWVTHRNSSTSYTTQKHVKSDLYGRGIGPAQGIHASGQSLAGGIIRTWEIFGGPEGYGDIRHALVIGLDPSQLYYNSAAGGYNIDAVNRGTLNSGYIWPAFEQDYNSPSVYSGQCPIGALAAIPPWVDVTTLGLPGPAVVVARCLQRYGCYVVDMTTLTWGLSADQEVGDYNMANWLGPVLDNLNTIRAQCRVVINSTKVTPGGGVWTGDASNRVAPLAPPLPPFPVARPV